LDILKSRATDIFAQQRGSRQFEQIGEKVIERLLPLFEGNLLTPNGKEAVAIALATTLDRSKLNPDLLVKKDLDPAQLAKHLFGCNPEAIRDFSEVESEFYKR